MKHNFKERDVIYIISVVETSRKYLNNELDNITTIDEMDLLCSDLFEYEDYNLLMFKGIWSDIDDIQKEIKEGKSTQKDLEDYIEDQTEKMKRVCKKILEEYSPILEDLKKKYNYQEPEPEEKEDDWLK